MENNDHPEDNQRRLEALQRSYIGALNPVSLVPRRDNRGESGMV